MSVENAYRMVRKLLNKSWPDLHCERFQSVKIEIIKILLELNPNTLVHALHWSNPICGRLREVKWAPETHWPVTEVWDGIQSGEIVNCPGCLTRLEEVIASIDKD